MSRIGPRLRSGAGNRLGGNARLSLLGGPLPRGVLLRLGPNEVFEALQWGDPNGLRCRFGLSPDQVTRRRVADLALRLRSDVLSSELAEIREGDRIPLLHAG